jgi:methyltransferase (TIGR00027 family)
MQDHQASKTALGVAYIRAAHQLLDRHPLLFPDPIALKLLGPDAEDAIHGMSQRHQSPYGKGLRSHVCLRSRFAEDMLAREAADGARWYILVGAGFDTFAYRQPAWARSLRIVEIDHPATQVAKRQMLEAAGILLPENLTFAAAEFTQEALTDVLAKLAIPASDHVCFSWLGVTMYLPEDAIGQSLDAMATVCDHPSVTLTFRQPPSPDSARDKVIGDFVAGMGEPFISAFTPEAIAAKLTERGFGEVDFLTPEKANDRYYSVCGEGLPLPRHTTIVHARK